MNKYFVYGSMFLIINSLSFSSCAGESTQENKIAEKFESFLKENNLISISYMKQLYKNPETEEEEKDTSFQVGPWQKANDLVLNSFGEFPDLLSPKHPDHKKFIEKLNEVNDSLEDQRFKFEFLESALISYIMTKYDGLEDLNGIRVMMKEQGYDFDKAMIQMPFACNLVPTLVTLSQICPVDKEVESYDYEPINERTLIERKSNIVKAYSKANFGIDYTTLNCGGMPFKEFADLYAGSVLKNDNGEACGGNYIGSTKEIIQEITSDNRENRKASPIRKVKNAIPSSDDIILSYQTNLEGKNIEIEFSTDSSCDDSKVLPKIYWSLKHILEVAKNNSNTEAVKLGLNIEGSSCIGTFKMTHANIMSLSAVKLPPATEIKILKTGTK